MNFILAWVIFTGLFMYGMHPVTVAPFSDEPTGSLFIPSFSEARDMGFVTYSGITFSPLTGSIAYNAGIRDGDVLESINNQAVDTREGIIEVISENKPLDILVDRAGTIISLTVTPEKGKVGMYINYENLHVDKEYNYQVA